MTGFLPFTRPDLDEETIAGVAEVLRSGWITSGPQVRAFEAALSSLFCGRPVRSANSGTATLELALALCGIGPGDEVITTPLTWAATPNVIVRAGARPVFADVDPRTRNIDPACVEAAVTPHTRALMPVDLAGLPAERDRLYDIARRHGLRVIEDAAQSMGASWRGRPIGSFGDLVSFSFHANKNITTGEGGCLVMNDEIEATRCERLRLQGVLRDDDGGMDVAEIGGKFNLTDIAARIGLGQLARLEEFTIRRRVLARHYFAGLDGAAALGLDLPAADFTDSNWHMSQVLLPLARLDIGRGDFLRALKARGIGAGVHYPAAHLFTAYRALGWREGMCPHAERIGAEIVTLPLFPAMSEDDVERVCAAVTDIFEHHLR
ncbi:MAG: DegT/DnrJ/EryC1/StrS aminotransferase family protein [Betaproteobacteria bacterium]|nr:DegT/DnrJ/EryC1/StrS aminotransferase family protein [Betaproteobacteria bacterium]